MKQGFIHRVAKPLCYSPDFAQPLWDVPIGFARGWVLASLVVDLIVQTGLGPFSWWTLLMSFGNPLALWWMPVRLMTALAHVSFAQGVVSALLYLVLSHAGAPSLVSACVLFAWQGWCMTAVVWSCITYLRTPKKAFLRAA